MRICFLESRSIQTPWQECHSSFKKGSPKSRSGIEDASLERNEDSAMKFLGLLAASAAFLAFGDPVLADKLPEPKSVTIDKSLSADQAQAAIHVARVFYAFWDTGDAHFARLALADNFTDRTLPKGRPQGIDRPIVASRNLRQPVPNLRSGLDTFILGASPV